MPDEVRITDSTGAPWTAREIPASRIEFGDELVEERAAHLRFEPLGDRARPPRTGRRYPADWRTLPHDELVELLEEAEPASPEPRAGSENRELRRHLDELST